jgi:hypothetical protein
MFVLFFEESRGEQIASFSVLVVSLSRVQQKSGSVSANQLFERPATPHDQMHFDAARGEPRSCGVAREGPFLMAAIS